MLFCSYDFGAEQEVCFGCREDLASGRISAGKSSAVAPVASLAPLLQQGVLSYSNHGAPVRASTAAAAACGADSDDDTPLG